MVPMETTTILELDHRSELIQSQITGMQIIKLVIMEYAENVVLINGKRA